MLIQLQFIFQSLASLAVFKDNLRMKWFSKWQLFKEYKGEERSEKHGNSEDLKRWERFDQSRMRIHRKSVGVVNIGIYLWKYVQRKQIVNIFTIINTPCCIYDCFVHSSVFLLVLDLFGLSILNLHPSCWMFIYHVCVWMFIYSVCVWMFIYHCVWIFIVCYR